MKIVIALALLSVAAYGQFFGSTNAKKLAGVPFICASPSDNDVITYDLATTSWVCGAGTGGSTVASPVFSPNGTDYTYLPTITRPSQTTFSWVNQGTATLVSTNGVSTIIALAAGSPDVKIRAASLPAPPYTVNARITGTTAVANYIRIGIGLRESGTGKLKTIGTVAGTTIGVEYWTSPTAYGNTSVSPFGFYRTGDLYLRIYNDGTNIAWSYSGDGIYFPVIHTAAKADSFTTAADQAFFYVDTNGSLPASVTLLSWSVL